MDPEGAGVRAGLDFPLDPSIISVVTEMFDGKR
jgi:hypothetical protein